MSTIGKTKLKTKELDEHKLYVEQLKSSSALTFARSLFHAAEGKELFEGELVFASAVSTYYSVFHLGAALMLACFSQPTPAGDPHTQIRKVVEDKRREGHKNLLVVGSAYRYPDPAQGIRRHDYVYTFLQRELPEVSKSLGSHGQHRALRDMREFVSYAPRMVSDGHQNILYSGCQYDAQDFKRCLKEHLERLDGFFRTAVRWIKGKSYNALYSWILSGDFVLFEFAELAWYQPDRVAKRAWAIYRSICEHEGADWRIWRPDPGTWHMREREERERYAEAIRRFGS